MLFCGTWNSFPSDKRNIPTYCGLEITTLNAVISVFQSVVAPLNHTYNPSLSTYAEMHFRESTASTSWSVLTYCKTFKTSVTTPCWPAEAVIEMQAASKNNKHWRCVRGMAEQSPAVSDPQLLHPCHRSSLHFHTVAE